ncbi:hypothetical protein BDS110ZK18_36550 [Bradyrhizobium diazoefficiens]|uniref:Uncharacterized protein n=1 Tax=Bradyrhizobium diazoefficiens TaxID=1355477 RepID=A0A809XM22_9BRAD|nr:hypothetical protein XF2B_07500 [Bradyrhizobium diazoefficiens]BCF14059.1 hypothetical protein XF13B_07500 [Bradyrhizobium diazoefficiens]
MSEDKFEPSHLPREPAIAEPDWIAGRIATVVSDRPVPAKTAALLQIEMRGPLAARRLSSGGLAALAEQLLKSLGED